MPVTVRASSVATGDVVTSVNVNKPAGTVSGDLLIAFVHSDAGDSAATYTAPAGWTQNGTTSTATPGISKVFTKTAGGSEPSSYAFGSGVNSSIVIIIVCVTGQATSSPVNINATWATSNTAGQASQVAPSISPTVVNCLLLCSWSSNNNTTASYTPPGGMTEMQDAWSNWQFASAAYQALTATGATGTRTATGTSGGIGWTAVSMAIAPAATSPGAFMPFLVEA